MMNPKNKGRVFAIIQFVLLGLILILSYYLKQDYSSNTILHYSGWVIIFIGLLIGIIAVVSYGQMVTANPYPLKEVQLRTSGIYGVIRHPMYLAALVFVIGWCILFFSYYCNYLSVIYFAFLMIKIKFEESQLVEKFPDYKTYQKKSSRLFPLIY